MIFLVVLNEEIFEMVTVWWHIAPGKFTTSIVVLEATSAFVINGAVVRSPTSPPLPFAIVTECSNSSHPSGWVKTSTNQSVVPFIVNNVYFSFVLVGEHFANFQSILPAVVTTVSSNVIFVEKIVPYILFGTRNKRWVKIINTYVMRFRNMYNKFLRNISNLQLRTRRYYQNETQHLQRI